MDDQSEAANRSTSSWWPMTITWSSDFFAVSVPAYVNVANRVVERDSTFECSAHPSSRRACFTRITLLLTATAAIDVKQIILGKVEGVELR
ncbi:MAG: hypothetical protein CL447_02395 [Acidimicrobiaceae bacterium]|nr:hypothetical protein [Acidimicrobiaceae bacterium]HBU75551.1 hypothetical protein [Acidimicrobiaceae bacterium]